MVLLDHIIQVFYLTDNDVGAVCLVVALDGRFVGLTVGNGDGLGDPMTTDCLPQKAPRGFCIIATEPYGGLPAETEREHWIQAYHDAHADGTRQCPGRVSISRYFPAKWGGWEPSPLQSGMVCGLRNP